MKTIPLKLVTIITEPVLTEKLLEDIKQLGSTGFTVTEVMGEGSRQLHSSEVPGQKNKIECIVPSEVSDKIVEHISKNYFSNYTVIAYVTDTAVVRGEKYT